MREYIWRSFRGVGGKDSNGIGAKIWGFSSRFESLVLMLNSVQEVEDDTGQRGSQLSAGREEKKN
jgi:hypothetical protein